MADDESLAPQIARLCDLQQQQLAKLTELVERFTRIADGSQQSHELYAQQAKLWQDEHKLRLEREAWREKQVLSRGIITLIILALIPIAIIVARFL